MRGFGIPIIILLASIFILYLISKRHERRVMRKWKELKNMPYAHDQPEDDR
jgi:hypothetical protein